MTARTIKKTLHPEDREETLRDIQWTAKHEGKAAGLFYTWQLASRDGAWFRIIIPPDTPEDEVEKAKAQLRNDRDVVGFTLLAVPEDFFREVQHACG